MKSSQGGPILSTIELAWTFYPRLVLAIAASGTIAGFVGILLVDAISTAIHVGAVSRALYLQFGLLVLLHVATNSLTFILPAFLGSRVNVLLRQRLYEQFVSAPLEDLERKGLSELLTLLNLDAPTVAQTTLILPFVVANGSVLAFGVLYILYQAPLVFAIVLVGILIGCSAYYACYMKGALIARQASDEYELLNEHLHGLVYGIKELKLNRWRRRHFRKVFFLSTEKAARFRFMHQIWIGVGEGLGQLCYLLVLSVVLLGAPMLTDIDSTVITSCLLCILFMMGPLTSLVNLLPEIAKGSVALTRMGERGFPIEKTSRQSDRATPGSPRVAAHWRSIAMVDIESKYLAAKKDGTDFRLGPINLTIYPGELVYVIGGNGSGKSTMARVLAGLYEPSAGSIYLDGKLVSGDNIEDYRGLFSAVYFDFHLFRYISSGSATPVDWVRAGKHLEELGLAEKVSIDGSAFSTVTALSMGQKRRLALLGAFIEDRPIYLFDEWAADQDPAFKRLFYETLIPKLRAERKCVIVITHDDQYFRHADRIIKLRDGLIESDERCGNEAAAAANSS